MAIPGQASGDFVESSSALRLLYVGTRNSMSAQLTADGFIQQNPPVVVAAGAKSGTLSVAPKRGVLGGSVAFTRPDAGNGYIGGPVSAAVVAGVVTPLGFFLNDAAGNAYENLPAQASGQAPYISGQGTIGLRLYETQNQDTNAALTYNVGDALVASVNGYVTNVADAPNAFELNAAGGGLAAATVLGRVKIVPDSVHAELIVDQRI